MTIFQVRHNRSGAILWTGEAENSERALDVAAQAAGYHHRGELPDDLATALEVEMLAI